jgi:hypothetical protein
MLAVAMLLEELVLAVVEWVGVDDEVDWRDIRFWCCGPVCEASGFSRFEKLAGGLEGGM